MICSLGETWISERLMAPWTEKKSWGQVERKAEIRYSDSLNMYWTTYQMYKE